MVGSGAGPVGLRRVDEVRQLLGLVDRGLLSDEEFERQMVKIYSTLLVL